MPLSVQNPAVKGVFEPTVISRSGVVRGHNRDSGAAESQAQDVSMAVSEVGEGAVEWLLYQEVEVADVGNGSGLRRRRVMASVLLCFLH